ncbi:MAG: diguanylate cyclase [Chloroflexi bacterium]|nr:diguanylate cyclase [Chloroflexota bacterium]
MIFLVPVWLAWLNIERTNYQISTPFFHINMSVGILLTLFLFALIFLTSQPEKTSFAAKFGGVMLTCMLAVFGIVGWLIAPSYAERYSPNIPDHRTLQYAPNERGGYDVSEIPFRFDPDLGQDIGSTISYADRTFVMGVDFDFPYFGNQYETIYISNTGAVSMGESLDWKNLQFHFSNIPAILALLVDFDPGKCTDCGIYIREDPGQLVVTYLKVPSLNHLSATYTFQIILHSNGSFNVTYNGLPEDLKFYVDDRPEATVWAIGIKPAIAPSLSVDLSDLPVQSNADGLIQDEYRAFRDYLNAFLRPVAIAILAGSLLVLIILFAVFRYGLAQPLDALLKGVQTFNSGGRDVAIPVKFNDEIGFLTESFNNLSGELNDMITSLEDRISVRTSELVTANDQLRKLSIAVEQSPSTIIITDTKARIEYVNSSFTLSTGYTFEEVRGKNPRILKSGLTPPETYKEMWDTILSGRTWRGELINRKKDGNNFWEFTVVAPIYNQEGQVTHYVAVKEDTTERRHAEQELERLAITDPLTGLSNRRYFFTQAEQFFIHANQPPFILSALMIDFDHFKHVNDQYGHATGDIVLSESARRIQANLRPSDVIGRYGGDELVVLLPRTNSSKARQIAERLCAIISEGPIIVGDTNISITVSVGIANMDEHTPTLEVLLQRADEAMYAAKQAGRNRCVSWQSRPASLSS